VYDPEADTWQHRSSMPTPRGAAAACVVDGIIYVFGGGRVSASPTSTVLAYDPATNAWTRKADIPTPRQGPAACAVDGIAYVIGGLVQSTSPTPVVEAYDPKADRWMRRAPMPSAAGVVSAAVVDGVIYVLGGGQAGGPGLPSVFAYDAQTDMWIRKANMPTARMGLCTCSVDGIIYAIGGTPYGGGPGLSTVEAYDPAIDSWTRMADMPTPRKYPACAVVDVRLCVIGGMQPVPLATLEVCDLTPPPPDFNGDGNVDGKDVLILAEHWGLTDSLCDIAPEPFGDGFVDLLDLIMLADHIGKDVSDPTLVAHWPLDEAEGVVAHDSAGRNDASVTGEPTWQTDAGKVGGALQFDGLDDCALTEFVLNPAGGPFSVLAWVKGGGPGQVIIAQANGANWLATDALDGRLETEFKGAGRQGNSLRSQKVVADGHWHRVGLVWDGALRTLYVDDVAVSEDLQTDLPDCFGGLNIGCGKDLALETFWPGLIDDIRIYSRAIKP